MLSHHHVVSPLLLSNEENTFMFVWMFIVWMFIYLFRCLTIYLYIYSRISSIRQVGDFQEGSNGYIRFGSWNHSSFPFLNDNLRQCWWLTLRNDVPGAHSVQAVELALVAQVPGEHFLHLVLLSALERKMLNSKLVSTPTHKSIIARILRLVLYPTQAQVQT